VANGDRSHAKRRKRAANNYTHWRGEQDLKFGTKGGKFNFFILKSLEKRRKEKMGPGREEDRGEKRRSQQKANKGMSGSKKKVFTKKEGTSCQIKVGEKKKRLKSKRNCTTTGGRQNKKKETCWRGFSRSGPLRKWPSPKLGGGEKRKENRRYREKKKKKKKETK